LWPESFDRLWALWKERLGKHAGPRAMVDLLQLIPEYGWPLVTRAAEKAICLGCPDAGAVKSLLLQVGAVPTPAPLSPEEVGSLSRYDRPLPDMSGYDQLLCTPRERAPQLGGTP
jgi:hypothetical protein